MIHGSKEKRTKMTNTTINNQELRTKATNESGDDLNMKNGSWIMNPLKTSLAQNNYLRIVLEIIDHGDSVLFQSLSQGN